MRHAFLILAHKSPIQLCRLVHTLDFNDTIFLIHVDSKIAIRPFLKQFENYQSNKIYFCPVRKSILWGSFTSAEATLSLIQYYFKLGLETDYVHLISGLDYPIQSANKINSFFKENYGKSFLNYFILPIEYWQEKGMNKVQLQDSFYNDLEHKTNKHPITNIPGGIIPYGGSHWWSLHLDCIRFILKECSEDNILYSFYNNKLIPDEIFFHTLIMNSPFKDTIVNENLRYIDWKEGVQCPKILNINDESKLINSGKLFAHKFDSYIDSEILNRLDQFKGSWNEERIIHDKNLTGKRNLSRSYNKRRWCIISAVGEGSLHRNWIHDKAKFDLHLIVYDDAYEKFKHDTKFITQSKGYKFKLVYNYLTINKQIIDLYDYFYIPDDDINIDIENIHRLFWYMKEYKLAIAQPALSKSNYFYPHTMHHPNSLIRFVSFVEIMQPCFSRDALKTVLFTFNENKSGWGIDFHWGVLMNYLKYNMAIIDDVISIHTRPVQSIYQPNNHFEMNEYMQKYNLKTEINEIY